MPIQRAKPLEALYDDVAGHDLVVVPDAPLADGLNRHLDRPRLGTFATTPRRLAAGRREENEERTVFLELLCETDLSCKQAAYFGEEIIHCWEYTGRPDGILDYEQFDRPDVASAVDAVRSLDITSRALSEYSIDPGTDVAVVAPDQLTELERSILPGEFDAVDRFADASFDRPPVRLFDSATDIVDAVLDTVTAENAGDVAVVLDGGSEFSPLVESALAADDVPFYGGPGFVDDQYHRAFLCLLRTAFRGQDLRVGDVRATLQCLGRDLGAAHDEKRFHRLDVPDTDGISEWCSAVRAGEWTFERALSEFESLVGDGAFQTFREELRTLELAARPVTESRVDDLEFYLQSYEVPIDREHDGVLLADAGSATHVDRPLVFYLGLDDDWTQIPPQRPWVDRDAEFTRHLRRFQLLLQNGQRQRYLVRDTMGGQSVTPCLYFEELLEQSVPRFSEFDAIRHSTAGGGHGDGDDGRGDDSEDGVDDGDVGVHGGHVGVDRGDAVGFDREPVPVDTTRPSTVSQSSLSTYVNSPRDYFFDRLVESPDRDYFREGNLFHDFAEFSVHHPEFVAERPRSSFVDVMLEEMEPFVRDVDREVHRSHYDAGLRNLVAFLEERAPDAERLVLDAPRTEGNTFAERFDRPIGADVTERWFENETVGVKGKIDLVASPTALADFKSGSKKSATQVVKNSALEELSDTPNFQALLYLTHQRSQHPGEELTFTFIHFLENVDDVVRGEADLDDTLTTITYHPTPYRQFVRERSTFERLRDEGANDCQKTLSKASYGAYAAAFEDADMPKTRDADELIDSAFGEALVTSMENAVGAYKYVQNGCEQVMRELVRIRNRNYFADDVDAFESFVDERLAELGQRRAGEERFPVADLLEEPNYRRVNHRDLVIHDD